MPAAEEAIIMDKLNTEDCTEVATSLALLTCRLTAACNKVTSGPNDSPHIKNATCAMPKVLPSIRMTTMETISKANMAMVSSLKYLSVNLIASNTEINEPTPNINKALSIPPARLISSTKLVI